MPWEKTRIPFQQKRTWVPHSSVRAGISSAVGGQRRRDPLASGGGSGTDKRLAQATNELWPGHGLPPSQAGQRERRGLASDRRWPPVGSGRAGAQRKGPATGASSRRRALAGRRSVAGAKPAGFDARGAAAPGVAIASVLKRRLTPADKDA